MLQTSFAIILGCALLLLPTIANPQQRGGDPEARATKNPVAPTAASIKAGQSAYGRNCRHCHGPQGKGDGPLAPSDPRPPDLTDDQWDHGSSDGEIFAIIWNGAPAADSQMKGVKATLTERDVWNIVNFVRSIGPETATR